VSQDQEFASQDQDRDQDIKTKSQDQDQKFESRELHQWCLLMNAADLISSEDSASVFPVHCCLQRHSGAAEILSVGNKL